MERVGESQKGGDNIVFFCCGFDSARFVTVAVICSIGVAGSIEKGVRGNARLQSRFPSSAVAPISGSNYRLRNNRGWKGGSRKGGDDSVFCCGFDSAHFVIVAVICFIAVPGSIQKGVRARFSSFAGSRGGSEKQQFQASNYLAPGVLLSRRFRLEHSNSAG
ncbi:hypothetical protein CEXT_20881 [Caerostris extrusa]|uniref:Uncharacterized protein n=1 Tax=Caerostris extrusa TaxID=172846 RepID=A0AAV4RG18_CAEEX|nr:hypothetical protein CEXT_20881 [Caerostris extrusa]